MLARKKKDEPLLLLEDEPSQSNNQKRRIESWLPKRAGWAVGLEKAALWLERPFTRIPKTAQLNPFSPQMAELAQVRVLLTEPAAPFARTGAVPLPTHDVELRFEVDGVPAVTQMYQPDTLSLQKEAPFYADLQIEPGTHHLRFAFYAPRSQTTIV